MARVLVVDDDFLVQTSLCDVVEGGGHQAVPVAAGADLLQEVDNAEFDLVVTDLQMPHVNGWQLAEWVAQHRPATPVIAVSGLVGRARQPQRAQLFDALLEKPFSPQSLLRAIDSALH